MAIRDLIVRVSAQSSDFEKRIASAQRSLVSLSEKASSIGQTATFALALPIGAFAAAALRSAAQFESLEKGLTAVSGSATEAQRQLERLKKVAELPGLGFREAVQGSINLQAAGFSAATSERALKAFGNALATIGKGRAELDGVILALGQIQSKGKFSAEELNQLAERLPQIRVALKNAFGTADTEVLQKLGLSTSEIINRIIGEFEKLPQVTGGLGNSFENIRDRIERSMAAAGKSLAPFAQAVLDAADPIIASLGNIAASFAGLPDPIKNATVALLGLSVAVGPISVIVANLQKLAAVSLGLAASPLTLPLLALGAAALATKDQLEKLDRAYDSLSQRKGQGFGLEDLKDPKNAAAIRETIGQIDTFGIRVTGTATAARAASGDIAAAFAALKIQPFGQLQAEAGKAKAALDQITQAFREGRATSEDVANATKAYHENLQKLGLETKTTTKAHREHREAVANLVDIFRDINKALSERTEGARLEQEIFRVMEGAEGLRDVSIPAAENLRVLFERSIDPATRLSQTIAGVQDEIQKLASSNALEQFGIKVESATRGLKIEPPRTSDEVVQDAIRQQQTVIQDAATKAGKIQFPTKSVSEFGRQISTVMTDMSRGIVDAISGTKSLGDAMLKVAQDISQGFLRFVIEKGIKLALEGLDQLLGKLFKVGSVFGSIFGGGGSSIGGAAGSVGKSASSAASSASSAAVQGLSGWIAAASSAVSAVFDVLQFTQLRRMEQDLGRVEVTTRGQLNQLVSIQGSLNQWLPYLGGIQGILGAQGAALQEVGDLLASGKVISQQSQVTAPITINFNGVTDARQQASEIVRVLRQLDPRFA